MYKISLDQMKAALSTYLNENEELEAIGIFKKVPSTSFLLLTRGMAWFLSRDFHIGVTDQRLVILPVTKRSLATGKYEEVIYADYAEVHLHEGPLNNTMLDIQKIYKGKPLNLRYKTNLMPEGLDLYEFITAVKQKTV